MTWPLHQPPPHAHRAPTPRTRMASAGSGGADAGSGAAGTCTCVCCPLHGGVSGTAPTGAYVGHGVAGGGVGGVGGGSSLHVAVSATSSSSEAALAAARQEVASLRVRGGARGGWRPLGVCCVHVRARVCAIVHVPPAPVTDGHAYFGCAVLRVPPPHTLDTSNTPNTPNTSNTSRRGLNGRWWSGKPCNGG